ncbi:MAG: hypothetical protein ACD_81C00076G0007 [uncultured bacterium]|uniref:Uncharacterized protein n=1 Tax=Candidatus Wolfebacteria bacterium GW2011_GWE2_44_13 TaxID=1619017 RepID=A0A0G1H737_9BACT|nr:MAG: hypothetical protein ACD_81C00076G0007 [uncultured bacterium]KKT43181.1 MAG: hypothetical protein UW32_C0002G0042 [Candidatus Wolfebacteria bacterium GW2011_GWE2_44_13]
MKIKYRETDAFYKDLKKLLKKFVTLEADLRVAKTNAIEMYHIKNVDNESVFALQHFCSENVRVYKLKKFACKCLKGRGMKSGIRVIYAYYPKDYVVEFVEIYFKGVKENEDKERIKEYIKAIIE